MQILRWEDSMGREKPTARVTRRSEHQYQWGPPGMAKPRVLVTGASGYVASQLLPTFHKRYDCTLIDVTTTDRDGHEVPDVQRQSLLVDDLDELRPLFTGCDAVVHLAFVRQTEDRHEQFEGEMDNIRMAYILLLLFRGK